MADAAPAAVSTPATPKQKKAAKPRVKKPGVPSTHPPAGQMVLAAIKALGEKGGSSLQAIKKYISANFKVDVAKIGHVLRRSLVAMVNNGKLVRAKGKGASGSFRISKAAKAEGHKKKHHVHKAKKEGGAASPKRKRVSKPKKAHTPKKAKATGTEKPKKVKASKPKAAKPKAAKPKAAKPKTAKPKTAKPKAAKKAKTA